MISEALTELRLGELKLRPRCTVVVLSADTESRDVGDAGHDAKPEAESADRQR